MALSWPGCTDWRGGAERAYRRQERELARLLVAAEHAVGTAVDALRRAEAVTGG